MIRLSGPRTARIVDGVFAGAPGPVADLPRGVHRGRVRDGGGEQAGLLLWMPGPRSYTREDVAELHVRGCAPLLDLVLAHVLSHGAVPAGRGEFTRRAFLNGRLDLTEAEGVLGLVTASDEAERRAAGHLLAGGLGERLRALREGLEELRGLCEASLDFDETDTGHVPTEELVARGERTAARFREALGWEVRRQPPRALPRVVLWGPPNAGKSSLFNALVRPDHGALVSDHAGTTRDTLAAVWELPGGGSCLLLDAPGEEAAARGADAAAQDLARRERESAALLLQVLPAGERETHPAPPASLAVRTKADLGAVGDPADAVVTSVRDGTGLADLGRAVERALGVGPGTQPGIARELFARHRQALKDGACHLGQAAGMLEAGAPLDLVAEALREATDALDAIAGRTSPEDLLDRIFAQFCIGK